MLTNLLKFLKGYVVIRLSGYSPERFLNLCSRHGIVLWGLRSVGTEYEMCISISGFRALRPLVHKTKTKVVILERHGLPFMLHRYRGRKLFALGAIGSAALLYALSLFIWNIHVEGNYRLSDQVILDYLEEEEIVHGILKSRIHGEEIEAKLREHFPDITWTSVEVKGTRLIVHVKENEDTAYEVVPGEEPADLVASKSGTVVSMIVRSGTPAVSEGAEVSEGDLLVSAKVEVSGDGGEVTNTYYVHGDADIRIRRREEYEASFPLHYEKKVYTGRKRRAFCLILGSRRLAFSLPGSVYESFDRISSQLPLHITENYYLPVAFETHTDQEYKMEEAVYSNEEAIARAKEELSLFFEKIRIKGLQIIENNVKIEINGDVCTAFGTYVVEEEAVRERAPEIIPDQEEPGTEREQT